MANASSEVRSMIGELNSIIGELTDIANGLKTQFQGIGSERCAQSIESVISNCAVVKSKLQNMDMNKVTDSWAAAHGAEGTAGGSW
ncbi:MAG: hypothetical protein II117_08030 [Clostridia bacterium]|nr:hypothetical protein [Clostridia bacterium]